MGTTRLKTADFDLFAPPPSDGGASQDAPEGPDTLFGDRPPGAPPHPRGPKKPAPKNLDAPKPDTLFGDRPPGAPPHPKGAPKKLDAPKSAPKSLDAPKPDTLFGDRPPGAPPHPKGAPKKLDAPKPESPKADTLFGDRPPGAPPHPRGKKPAEKPAEAPKGDSLFGDRPPGAPPHPRGPQKPAEAPKAPAPPPAPKAPTPAPVAPPKAPTPAPPVAPAPPKAPTRKEPDAPIAPQAPGQPEPATGDMRKMREFREFVKQRYEGGKKEVRHPEPKPNRREFVKFWTGMRYRPFVDQIKREFAQWQQEQEAQRPRLQPGDKIRSLDGLRVGDRIGSRYTSHYKITAFTPKGVKAIRVNGINGLPFEGEKVKKFSLTRMKDRSFRLHEPVVRKVPPAKTVDAFLSNYTEAPPRVKDQDQYRKWLENILIRKNTSPYHLLNEKESPELRKQFKQEVDRALENRGIGADWKWTPPKRVEIGEKAHHPHQLETGDFFERRLDLFRVVRKNDEGVLVRQVGRDGRPIPYRGQREFDMHKFKREPAKRIPAITRPDVSATKATEFANKYFGAPPRAVSDAKAYRKWLEDGFRTHEVSPYEGLAKDETEHEDAMNKQIDKILKARKVGPDWEWVLPNYVKFPSNLDWEKHQDAIRDAVAKGTHVEHPNAENGKDAPMGPGAARGISEGTARRIMMGLDGKKHEFVHKPQAGESYARQGCPPGTLHLREQSAYNLDRLFGEGTVVPPTASDGAGSYQQFQAGAQLMGNGGLGKVRGNDLIEHPEVQRTVFLDVLMGHEDRHGNNQMFSWKDPSKPKTADNIQFHAIDNGYAFGSPSDKNGPHDYTVRHPWGTRVVEDILENGVSPELHKKMKDVKMKDLVSTLLKGGITDIDAVRAAAVKLRALQNDPKALAEYNSTNGQKQFHYTAGKTPEKLVSKEDLKEIDDSLLDYMQAA